MALSLQKTLALNTASNYALMAIRMVQGVLFARWLFHYLGKDLYGFWGILWAFFTYIVIFNMGFGAAAQKYTAERLFEKDIKKYNGIISIIFNFYFLVALVVSLIIVAAAYYIRSWTDLADEEKIFTCQISLIIFGVGTAIIFLLSTFHDIIGGLKLIYIKNCVFFVTRIFELVGVLLMMHWDMGLLGIVSYSIALNILLTYAMIFIVKWNIKGFKIGICLNWGLFKEIYNFSLYAYLNSIGNVIIAKTDRFVLSSMLGLDSVGTYQMGTRMPDISQMLSSQFQDNVVPVSAHLVHSGDKKTLSSILMSGLRFGAFTATGATALFFCLTDATMQYLFKVSDAEVSLICKTFLISQFVSCAVRGVPSRYLLMAGKHKLVASATLIEAVLNLSLSIVLCSIMGIMGVVWGTIIPNVIISCFVLAPIAAKSLDFNIKESLLIYIRPLLAIIPSIIICEYIKLEYGSYLSSLIPLTGTYLLSGSVYLALSMVFVLKSEERNKFLSKLPYLKKFAK